MAQEKIKSIITQLKKLKDEKKLSINEILDTLDRTNNHLSRSTVIKIFSDGSEDYGYQYDTIRTLADALFGVYSTDESDNPEIKGLKSTIQYQNIIIDQLKEQIEQLKTQMVNEESASLRRIDFLRDRVEKQDIRIEQKDRLITLMLMMHLKRSDKELCNGISEYFQDTLSEIDDYLSGTDK